MKVSMGLEPVINALRGLLLLSLLLDVTISHAQSVEELKKGVVKITAQADGKTRVGTGFVVKIDTESAYIVTAAHVVSGDSQPRVQFFARQDVPVRAQVKHAEGGDDETGMALLTVRGKENVPTGLVALQLATTIRISGGEDIMVIGHPRGAGDWAILKGSIASRQGRYLTVDANIDEGNSGGPIIQNGQVVGLIGGAQRYGKGVTIGTVREYLEGHGIIIQSTAIPDAAKHSRTPQTITGKDGAPMVLIPAGEFMMGIEGYDDFPPHRVALDAFYLDKYEVTNRIFHQFVQQTGHRTTAEREGNSNALLEGEGMQTIKGANWRQPEGERTVFASNRFEHPVVSVSWEDADAFCRWARKRLPTEAEWEYAARAGTKTLFWWGNGSPGSRLVENIRDEAAKKLLKEFISGYDDGSVRTAPVGSYEANPWGLHDMGGNVEEWTADWYDGQYYLKSSDRNPKGPSSGEYRVSRGGSWQDHPGYAFPARRLMLPPRTRIDYLGFRCAQDVPK